MARKPKDPIAAPVDAAAMPQWPADRVERRALDALVPYAKNARTHSAAQVAQLAASVRQWGWTIPVLVDEAGGIIAGHGRVLAAKQLGLTEVPVMIARGWTEAQKRAYVIADNRLALGAGWDNDLLRVELGDLRAGGFDLGLTGFALPELDVLLPPLAGGGQTDADDLPEPDAAIVTQPGDVWLLGEHRLMCGDSTSAADVACLAAGRLADLCFTSPPYGNQREYTTGGISDWDALMRSVFGALPVRPDAQILVNLGLIHRESEWMPYWDGWIEWMRTQGWRRFGFYVWDQGPGLPGDWSGRLAPAHEFVFHFNQVAERARKTKESKFAGRQSVGKGLRSKDGTIAPKTGAGRPIQSHKIADSVIRVMRHKANGIETAHPAVFPVALVSEMLLSFSDPGDVVFEPFSGSGTQLISAQENGRVCLAMELAPVYVNVAVRRWQMFTDQSAVLERTGERFDQLLAA
jgi:DNA modification methylase